MNEMNEWKNERKKERKKERTKVRNKESKKEKSKQTNIQRKTKRKIKATQLENAFILQRAKPLTLTHQVKTQNLDFFF